MSGNRASSFSFFSSAFSLGFLTVISQTVLLREMLVQLNGNEIVFSIFLSLWLVITGIGTLVHRISSSFSNTYSKLCLFSLLYCLMPVIQFLLLRVTVEHFSPASGVVLDIPVVFFIGTLVLAPGCLTAGYIFPLICDFVPLSDRSLQTVYLLESIGMITGGLYIYTGIKFVHHMPILFSAVFFALLINWLAFGTVKRLVLTITFFVITIFSNNIFHAMHNTVYKPDTLLTTSDSPFGRLDVTDSAGQKNYYWNGQFMASDHTEQKVYKNVGFSLLQHETPKSVLVIGGLFSGYAKVFSKHHKLKQIHFTEMDPEVVSLWKKTAPRNIYEKVNIFSVDALRFLRTTENRYDIVFLNLPDPLSMQVNRYYTKEFFELLSSTLSPMAVVVANISTGRNMVLEEQQIYAGIVWKTFSEVFKNTVFIPGDDVLFIGSSDKYISNDLDTLTRRYNEKNMDMPWFTPAVILSSCNKIGKDRFTESMGSSDQYRINTFAKPEAFLAFLQFNFRKLGFKVRPAVEWLHSNNIKVFIIIFMILALWIFVLGLLAGDKFSVINNFNIFSASFSSFSIQVILLYLFQTYYGFVYDMIALFTVTFMAGLSLGFYLALIISIHPAVSGFILTIVLISVRFIDESTATPLLFFLLNSFTGFLEGFLLSSFINIKKKNNDANALSFYLMDVSGAAFSGFLLSVLIIPVYSFFPAMNFSITLIILMSLFSIFQQYKLKL